MSWTPDLTIGELRPWPDSVYVVRGNRIDSRVYVPEDALIHMELHECPACANVADLQDALAENDRLRELLVGAFEDMNAWQMVIAGSNEWGYGKGCLDRLCELRDAMQELGMEVEV